jgi:uncharacterized repeat protein (TIGR01451 family)
VTAVVFHDLNGNGMLDPGEPRLPGVTVELIGAGPDDMFGTPDDVVYPAQQTGAGGSYSFTLLPPGEYEVAVDETTLPADLTFATTPNPQTGSVPPGGSYTTHFGYGRPDLAIAKTGSGSLILGSQVVYVLVISNVGSAPAAGLIEVIDPLPAGLSYVSGSGAGWTCGAVMNVVTCTSAGPIHPGTSSQITLTAVVDEIISPALNRATVSVNGDTNETNDADAMLLTTPAAAPTLSLAGFLAAVLVMIGVALIAMRRTLRSSPQRR